MNMTATLLDDKQKTEHVRFQVSDATFQSTHHPKRRLSTVSRQMIEQLYPMKYNIPPLTIIAALFVPTLPSTKTLKQLIQERLVDHFYRFSCIPQLDSNKKNWIWKQDDQFDLDNHIIEKQCADVDGYIDSILFNAWTDPETGTWNRPYWNVHFVQSTEPGSSSVILFEIHHCMGDGISLMRAASKLMDDEHGNRVDWVEPMDRSASVGTLPKKASVSSFWNKIKLACKMPYELGKIAHLLNRRDSPHRLKQPDSPYEFHKEYKVVVMPKIPLSIVKAIKDKAQCTVNDVLASAMAGALYRYLVFTQDPLLAHPKKSKRLRIRAVLPWAYPVNDGDLHNSFAAASIRLPVSSKYPTPMSRLGRMKRYSQQLKKTAQPILLKHIQSFLTHHTGIWARGKFALNFFTHHSLIFSNVKGFDHPVFICGEKVQEIRPIVPSLVHDMTLVSYNGYIDANIVMEKDVMEKVAIQCKDKLESAGMDAYSLLSHFYELEIEELKKEINIKE